MARLQYRHGQGKIGCVLWLLVLLAAIGVAAKLTLAFAMIGIFTLMRLM